MAESKNGAVYAIVAVPLLIVGGLFGFVLVGSDDNCGAVAAGGSSVSIDPASVPDTDIAGYGREQLVNAANVIQAGKDLGLNVRDQAIGVMTAMGESSLQNIDYGDWETGGVTNPDGTRTTSIGLFQQQDGWGSREERLDPYIASTKFFQAMIEKVPDRESLEPTIVAHRTQINADPYHYTRYWDGAVQIVEGLTGVKTGLNPGDGSASGGTCAGLLPGDVNAEGWASPAAGPVTSPYGMRTHPIYGTQRLHSGTDLAGGGCDGPIWAAQDGVVTFRGFDGRGNGTISVDHGGGVTTRYLHSYDSGMLVQTGDKVKAGQQIARVGSSGESTGCHLHFEVRVNGENVDPVPFMAEVGIQLGQ
ncbi:M23 family metallopeptidase [Microbacterium sp. NPDC077663]|uniref:M23 family metallopeptidase n=1 Tax=Microbacterium sp. NPDC077663 TaxID=3364189 RepID=UPI0037CC41DA